MKETSVTRKRLTLAERAEVLARYRSCQLTQREFARQQGIGLSTLQNWLRQAPKSSPASGPSFLSVPNLLAVAPAPPTYRIAWPGGMTLEVRPGFAAQELATLLQLLPPL